MATDCRSRRQCQRRFYSHSLLLIARVLSSLKEQRVAASEQLTGPSDTLDIGDKAAFVEAVRKALYLSKIISYAQGFAQMRAAGEEYGWPLDYGRIAAIFREGCIIRARFLQKITDAYENNPELTNLLLDPYFKDIADRYQDALREVVGTAVKAGVPVPCFASAIAYYDSYRSEKLPANLIQAQRGYQANARLISVQDELLRGYLPYDQMKAILEEKRG